MEKDLDHAIRLLNEVEHLRALMVDYLQEVDLIVKATRQQVLANPPNSSDCQLYVPFVDRTTMRVHWNGRVCELGATILLRLMERLCRHPNRFVFSDTLLEDVWQGDTKSECTVRSTIRRLKGRLKAAGMGDLVARIRCRGGRYALLLGRTQGLAQE